MKKFILRALLLTYSGSITSQMECNFSAIAKKPAEELQFLYNLAHKKIKGVEISKEDHTHAKKLITRGLIVSTAIAVAARATIGGVIIHKRLLRKPLPGYKSKKNTTLYSHGFGSVSDKATRYADREVIPNNWSGTDYQDADRKVVVKAYGNGFGLKTLSSCIGQEQDVETLSKQVDTQAGSTVLFGESRGASTIANYIGSDRADLSKVKAVVLDSPFSSMQDVISHRMKRFHIEHFTSAEQVEKLLAKLFRNYDPNGMQPINSLGSKNEKLMDLPILLICSKTDTQVPHTSSKELYQKLKASGHKKVHILELDQGNHGWIMEGPEKDKYRNVVHAFYQKYGIDHIEKYAQEGAEYLQSTQP